MPADRDISGNPSPTSLARRAVGKVRRTVGGTPPPAAPAPDHSEELKQLRRAVKRAEAQADKQQARLAKQQARIARLERNQTRLTEIVHGISHGEPDVELPDVSTTRQEARRHRALATYADLLSQGVGAPAAQIATVRACLDANDRHLARAFVIGVTRPGDEFREIGLGAVITDMAVFDRAWELFARADRDLLADLVPVEAVTAALSAGDAEAVAAALWIAQRPGHPASTLAELAPRLLVTGHREVAQQLADEVFERSAELSGAERAEFAKLDHWFAPTAPAEPPAGALKFGLIGYHQPDQSRASRNVGDYVQTLALLGNLARFRGVRFSGADGLGELGTTIQSRVTDDLHLPSTERPVHLIPVSRDFSDGDQLPEDTWMVAFGWHMHSSFRLNFGLPYHRHIKPIFVSFHINRVATLDEPTIAYLKANGPIGCRDWTTVDLLLSAGVDAFFTGCLTTTVNAVYPDLASVPKSDPQVTAVIDVPDRVAYAVAEPKHVFTHVDPVNRSLNLVEGTRAALDLLDTYQRDYSHVVTSRLHSYLPATSIGIGVDFRPDKVGDVRFDGLLGMSPGVPAFTAIRDGIRELLAGTFGLLLEGADEEMVRADWRRRTAPMVAAAKERFRAPAALTRPEFDVAAAVAAVATDTHAYGPHDSVDPDRVVDVAMSLDANFKALLPVTVASLLANASGPVRLWVTERGLDEDYRAWFHAAFPDLPVTFLGCDSVDYGEIDRMIGHITVATMDRLLLPELLPDLDRITYVDIDTVTEGDVCELAATDLSGTPLAGRPGLQMASVCWRDAGNHLDADRASELRRLMSARHAFDFATVNCGVLVLDLARMRADNFVAEFVPMARHFGLNDQDIVNAYAGTDRVELDPRWNALPLMVEDDLEPGIIHYAGAGKPWNDALVPASHKWQQVTDRLVERVGALPA